MTSLATLICYKPGLKLEINCGRQLHFVSELAWGGKNASLKVFGLSLRA